ncbi:MAG TPA: hypothetical protein VGN69_03850 [Solirubrobacteraceae bacterium]|jgi:hypothetical protein|nr:hypothetical protein [Solirubrobacteraceae bacterium]
MGIWSRLIRRQRGVLAEDQPDDDDSKTVHLARPAPTRGSQVPAAFPPTAGTRVPGGPEATAGTPRYGTQGGTPSTQRIHNPTRPGR